MQTRAWLVAIAMTVAPAVALAQRDGGPPKTRDVYRWTDDGGELHFTDDPSTIPAKYRRNAEVTRGEPLDELRAGLPTPTAPSPSVSASSSGPDEQEWRGRFKAAHDEIARLEKAIADDKERLAGSELAPRPYGGGMRINPEAVAAERRVVENEKRLIEAKQRLEDLDRQAGYEAVPREWRR